MFSKLFLIIFKPVSRCDEMVEKGHTWSDLEMRALLEIWNVEAIQHFGELCAMTSCTVGL